MPIISADFRADFSKFAAAVEGAQATMKTFEGEAANVAKSMSAMENSISGVKIVQAATIAAEAVERLGGVTKLTKDELERLGGTAQQAVEKMQKLGQDVPAGIQTLADAAHDAGEKTGFWNSALSTLSGTFGALSLQRVIDQAIQFGKEVFTTASQLENLHAKTEISVEALQGFKKVGDDTGVSLETIAGAAVHLQIALGEGEASTGGQLEQIGLHFQDIKGLSMEDAFLKVAQALKETEDHTKQVAVGSDLMGKSFAETLPAVRKGFDESKDSATVWSATTVQVLDTAQNNATTFVNYIKAGFGQVIADALTGTTEGFRRMKDSIDQLVDGTLKKAAGENYWQQILPPGLPKDLDDIIAKSDDWAQKTKAQGDALAEIADLGKDWNAEIKTMNPATVELAQNALAHGANQKTVADAYGLTAGAVKYLDDTMKAYQETLKAIEKIETDTRLKKEEGILGLSKIEQDASQKRFEAESRGLDQIGKAEADLRDLKEKNALDTTSYQILKIWEKADAEIAAFKGTKEQAEQHKAIVTQLAEEQVNAIQYAAETSIDHVAKHGVGKVAEAASQLETLIGGIKLPGSSEVHAFGQTYITSPTGQRIAVGPHGELPDSFWQQYSGQSSFSSGINNQPRIGSGYVPSFAEGGVGDFGSGTLAMLHGKEAIVPLGAGGAAGATTIQIYVTQPLGTPAQIADVVGRALMQNLRSQGVRVPPGA